jgi:hypothetical protein
MPRPRNANKPKEKWGKPKLIVLVRGSQAEAVLDYCKTLSGFPHVAGPVDTLYRECRQYINTELGCEKCDTLYAGS